MQVKVIDDKDEYIYEFVNIRVTHLEDGIDFLLQPQMEVLNIPRDGSIVYVMNSQGDTVDTYRWPPKEQI